MNDLQRTISTETALALLTKPQRRQILRRVADTPGGTTVDQLKTHLDVPESATSDGEGSVDRGGIELHHVHLPMLREANVIEYDASRNTVRRGRAFHDVRSLLEAIEDHREEASPTRP